MKSIVCVCVLVATVMLASCSKDEEAMLPGVTSEQAVARFKSYFYKEDGQVRAYRLSNFADKEWAVAAEESNRPCEVFTEITGVDAPLTGDYEYTYRTSDGKCTLKLVGTDHPKEDAVYAVLYVKMKDCPDIGKIYIIATKCFMNDNISMSGVPVIL